MIIETRSCTPSSNRQRQWGEDAYKFCGCQRRGPIRTKDFYFGGATVTTSCLKIGAGSWHFTTKCQKRGACVLCFKPQRSLPHQAAWVRSQACLHATSTPDCSAESATTDISGSDYLPPASSREGSKLQERNLKTRRHKRGVPKTVASCFLTHREKLMGPA